MVEDNNKIDIRFVEDLRVGNKLAFRSLYDTYHQDIYGFAISLLKSKSAAEEIVQEVFLKVWLHRENLNPELSFKSYIFTIARNLSLNALQKAANDNKLKEVVFNESQVAYDNADYDIREEQCDAIKDAAINELSPKRKTIFKLSREEGKSYDEISKELGISVQTVKNQMSKSLENLRVVLHVKDGIL
jgi:RNA polymerase sigma-70 factor (ECF subfamily)